MRSPLTIGGIIAVVIVLAGGLWFWRDSIFKLNPTSNSSNVNLYATGDYWVLPSVLTWGVYVSCNGSVSKNSQFTIDFGDGTSGMMTYVGQSISVENTVCLLNWSASEHNYNKKGDYEAVLYENGTQVAVKEFFIW